MALAISPGRAASVPAAAGFLPVAPCKITIASPRRPAMPIASPPVNAGLRPSRLLLSPPSLDDPWGVGDARILTAEWVTALGRGSEIRACVGKPNAEAKASTCSCADGKRLAGSRSHARRNHASNPAPKCAPRVDGGGMGAARI